jgi:RsiW-degrading membrane proteinase PrsW (M82 family)
LSAEKFFGTTDDRMSVLVPIVHNMHHHNEPDISSVILFFNDQWIANMHRVIQIGRLLLQLLSAVLYEFSSTRIMIFIFYVQNKFFPMPILLLLATVTLGMIGLVVVVTCSAMTIKCFACLANSMGYSYRTD